MTQLSLFDAPVTNSTVASVAVSAPVTPSPVKPAAVTRTQPNTVRAPLPNGQAGEGAVDGVQRMGDLARLVLMRYELVAQRRAALMEKRARALKAK